MSEEEGKASAVSYASIAAQNVWILNVSEDFEILAGNSIMTERPLKKSMAHWNSGGGTAIFILASGRIAN